MGPYHIVPLVASPTIHQVHEHGCPELRTFAAGLLKEHQAVRAGLTERYSQGPTEGHVTRLKLIKRQGYGRARFDLLRARVLHRV
jgi:transposase